MSTLHAFTVVRDDEEAECLQSTTERIPLAEILALGVQSFVPGRVRHRRGWPHGHMPRVARPRDRDGLELGMHMVDVGGDYELVRGVVRARDAESFPDYLVEHFQPRRGTGVWRWLEPQGAAPASGEWDERSREALKRLPRLLAPYRGVSATVPGFPGLYGTDETGCHEFVPVPAPGPRPLVACEADGDVDVTVTRRVGSRGGRVPMTLRLRVTPAYEWSYFDGTSFQVGKSLATVPRRVWSLMDKRGVVRPASDAPMWPATDLRPCFLVRAPSLHGVRKAGGPAAVPPSCAQRPAMLFPTTGPVPLLDGDGCLRDIPIVTRPDEAASILLRASGREVYVPHGPPLDMRDLAFPYAEWIVGVALS